MASRAISMTGLFTILLALQVVMPFEQHQDCIDKTFCEIMPDHYPQNEFDDFVLKMSQGNIKMPQSNGVYNDYEKRNNDENNCNSIVSHMKPYTVSLNLKTKLVLQSKYFEQNVTQTECNTNKKSCFDGLLYSKYFGTCTTTKGVIKLYVYDPFTKDIVREDVPISVCCSCVIQSM